METSAIHLAHDSSIKPKIVRVKQNLISAREPNVKRNASNGSSIYPSSLVLRLRPCIIYILLFVYYTVYILAITSISKALVQDGSFGNNSFVSVEMLQLIQECFHYNTASRGHFLKHFLEHFLKHFFCTFICNKRSVVLESVDQQIES